MSPYETPPPTLAQEAYSLSLAIARAIRVARDEKDAVRRICTLLGIWEINIDPGELGSCAQESSRRSGPPSP